MNKVMRYQIIKPVNSDWKLLGDTLRKSQRETRQIMNRTIQLCWEWDNFCSEYKSKNSVYPKPADFVGFNSIAGHIYNIVGKDPGNIQNTGNISQAIDLACQKWKSDKKDVYIGERSIASYKNNNPIVLHKKSIHINKSEKSYHALLSLVDKGFKKENDLKSCQFEILINEGQKSSKDILDRCISGEYEISASQILNDGHKWFLNLSYSFEPQLQQLDPEKILGIDMGIIHPVYLAVGGGFARASVDGSEILKFRATVEARKRKLQRQGKYCGQGRIGHGIKTRIKPIENISNKIERFRDTTNHKYSRFVIDFAEKHGCGTIQMENLTGITKDQKTNKFLRSWSYYDLQQKIEYKASEKGIAFILVKPNYTSQRCNKCGYIDAANRENQSTFICKSCGFKTNADYNAALNIAIKDIDKIIEATTIDFEIALCEA